MHLSFADVCVCVLTPDYACIYAISLYMHIYGIKTREYTSVHICVSGYKYACMCVPHNAELMYHFSCWKGKW